MPWVASAVELAAATRGCAVRVGMDAVPVSPLWSEVATVAYGMGVPWDALTIERHRLIFDAQHAEEVRNKSKR